MTDTQSNWAAGLMNYNSGPVKLQPKEKVAWFVSPERHLDTCVKCLKYVSVVTFVYPVTINRSVLSLENLISHMLVFRSKIQDLCLQVSSPKHQWLRFRFEINTLYWLADSALKKGFLSNGNEGLELVGTIPEDDMVYEYDLNGRPTIEMPEDNKAVKAAFEIFEKIIK